ncbi:hypothetical protein [Wenxinia marina]|uniref:Dihydroorotate dehydrogenase n=1 Tax=Wenxinia marina DSM 24838 TaxID=1123501 RepID=A0A0D0QBR3_9RHOB|nr:hypothetical protein [Wenxinia marina]KIQ69697.1 hypothetical protein Wenmar_02061 [Wenxinia marina DSM 24838]GGL60481.1 hypothetical protein GCM10011392_13680 [Wenxinia marina]
MSERDRVTADEAALERLLDEVAAARPAPPDDFMTRLLAEAEAARPRAAVTVGPARAGLRGWFAAIGGWPALGGLVASTVAGVWIGAAPPSALDGYLTGSLSVDILPDGVTLLEDS